MHPDCYCIFEMFFVMKKGVGRFGDFFETSKNDPKSMGICPGALISHFGINKNHKNRKTNR